MNYLFGTVVYLLSATRSNRNEQKTNDVRFYKADRPAPATSYDDDINRSIDNDVIIIILLNK